MTRGDFYIGTGSSARWIGSITHDAFPDKIPSDILIQVNAIMFEETVIEFLEKDRINAIIPSDRDGWPWPWDDSQLTDYTYMFDFDNSRVIASHFGGDFFDPLKIRQGEDLNAAEYSLDPPKFPIMKMEINKDGSYTTQII